MGRRRFAGVLWLLAGLTCAGLFLFVFIGEHVDDLGILLVNPARPALVLGGALVALPIGSLLLTRPGRNVVRLSSLAGIAWLIGFGLLVFEALRGSETGPVVSSSLITCFGIAGAVLGYLSGEDGAAPRRG